MIKIGMQNIICVIMISVAVLLINSPSVDAYPTIEVNPVEGSRIPGCQDEHGCFTPNDIRTKVGSLIIFKNTDETAHSFTSNKFNSQLMINDGQEFVWVVEQGKVEYSCLLHPWANGSITGVTAPTMSSFMDSPEWTFELFNWYEDDVIDYDTFMNAIIYLMSYDILKDSVKTEIQTEVIITEEPRKSAICENVLC